MGRGTTHPFPDDGHDHRRCMSGALDRAEALCHDRGVRLTALRRRVLEIIWTGHRPVGAYEVLDILRSERTGAQPPTVYRALEFLLEQGLVHRIESHNAYVGCRTPETRHGGQFLICRDCGMVAELDDGRIDAAIRGAAAETGFAIENRAVEVEGLCPHCRDKGHA